MLSFERNQGMEFIPNDFSSVFRDTPDHRFGTGSDGKERSLYDFDRTDTQSSLASGGRLSLPDSTDMVTLDMVSKENQNNHSTKDFDISSEICGTETSGTSPSKNPPEVNEEDIFRPSEDRFFKISNPVSEQLGIFNDINVIQEQFSPFEIIDENSVISNDRVTADGRERNGDDTQSAIMAQSSSSQLGGARVSEGDENSGLGLRSRGPKSGKKVLHVDSANLRVGVGGDITLHNTNNYGGFHDDPAGYVGDNCDKTDVGKHDSPLDRGDKSAEKTPQQASQNSSDVSPSTEKTLILPNAIGEPPLLLHTENPDKKPFISRKSSSDSDSSENFRSFKTAAFKHSIDVVVDSDTKSYESLNSSSPQEVHVPRETTSS